MTASEHDMFSRYEREIGRDLSAWRHDIIGRFERHCVEVLDAEEARLGELDLDDPTVVGHIRSQVSEYIGARWDDIEGAPHEGDILSVTGECFWYALNTDRGALDVHMLAAGYTLQGKLAGRSVLPYVNQFGLVAGAERNRRIMQRYLNPFGLHLVLDAPTFRNHYGAQLAVSPERVFLPIHYDKAVLKLYTAR